MRSLLLLFFLTLLHTSEAAVLVFKGSCVLKSFPANGEAGAGAYLVYDTNSRNYTLVRLYRESRVKKRGQESGTFFVGAVTLPKGREATILGHHDEFNEIATAFRSLFRLKGTNSTLLFNAQNQTMIFPAVFTGTWTAVSFFNGTGATEDRRLTLKFQPAITKDVQSKTYQEAVFHVHTLASQQGYGAAPVPDGGGI